MKETTQTGGLEEGSERMQLHRLAFRDLKNMIFRFCRKELRGKFSARNGRSRRENSVSEGSDPESTVKFTHAVSLSFSCGFDTFSRGSASVICLVCHPICTRGSFLRALLLSSPLPRHPPWSPGELAVELNVNQLSAMRIFDWHFRGFRSVKFGTECFLCSKKMPHISIAIHHYSRSRTSPLHSVDVALPH